MNKRTYLATALFLLAGFQTSCRPTLKSSKVAYILGDNDIVTVSAANDIPNVRKATVLLATKKSNGSSVFCTGSMIKNDQGILHVVTNHHCFAQESPGGDKLDAILPEACTETRVFFDFVSGNNRKAPYVKCLPGTLRTDPRIDVGVFQMEGQPPSDAISLSFFKGDPAGRKALIFHHPARKNGFAAEGGGEVSLPLAALTVNDCRVLGDFSIDDMKLDPILQVSLRHTCDLDLGSSGSALIDAETSRVLGINWGGITISESGKDINRRDNTATKVMYAEAFLNRGSYNIASIADSGEVKKTRAKGIGCTLQSSADEPKYGFLLFMSMALGVFFLPLLTRWGSSPTAEALTIQRKSKVYGGTNHRSERQSSGES